MSTKLPNASTTKDGIILNTAQTINGDKQANVSDGQSWVFDRVYTASSTSNAIGLFQRTGGAVALAIGYSDSPIAMYMGTTTAHPMHFRTSNTFVGSIDANGIWNFGISTLTGSGSSVGHTMNGPMQLGGKRTSSGTWSLGGVSVTAADDTERLAFYYVDTALTSGTARFQYSANKAGSGVHGWGIDSSGQMTFGRGTASTGFIDISVYALVSQNGVWTFGPTNNATQHTLNGAVNVQLGTNNTTNGLFVSTGLAITNETNLMPAFINNGTPGAGSTTVRMQYAGQWNSGGYWGIGVDFNPNIVIGSYTPSTGKLITAFTTWSATGVLTANAGIKLPNPSGGTATLLDHYEEFATTVTFTMNGAGGGTTAAIPLRLIRIGGIVSMRVGSNAGILTSTGVASNATALVATAAIPSRFRPAGVIVGHAEGYNNGAEQATPAMVQISNSTGSISIFRDGTQTTIYTNSAASSGIDNSCTMTWPIT